MSENSRQLAPREFWEQRYGSEQRVWSGHVNAVLADITLGLAPGRALDLGCGEGGDALWLAQHGWQVTGVDISETAIERARATARAQGLSEDRARFFATDLSTFSTEDEYELITASFLQSPVVLDRVGVLRTAAVRVATGGHLLVTSHGPPTCGAEHGHKHDAHYKFQTPAEELEALGLDPDVWNILVAELRSREVTGAGGEPGMVHDSVVLLRRR
ncbi:MAG: class I SAM-dependent methyltransferase [Rhodoglobus sp.]